MKGRVFFQGKIISKWRKYIDEIFFPEPIGQPDLAQNILGCKEFKFVHTNSHVYFE